MGGVRVSTEAGRAASPAKLVPHGIMVPEDTPRNNAMFTPAVFSSRIAPPSQRSNFQRWWMRVHNLSNPSGSSSTILTINSSPLDVLHESRLILEATRQSMSLRSSVIQLSVRLHHGEQAHGVATNAEAASRAALHWQVQYWSEFYYKAIFLTPPVLNARAVLHALELGPTQLSVNLLSYTNSAVLIRAI